MTAREFIKHIEEDGKYTFSYEQCMEKFAKYKCQELLEIVVKKVKIKKEHSRSPNVKSNYGDPDVEVNIVDKDSIFNAVDLDSFCS